MRLRNILLAPAIGLILLGACATPSAPPAPAVGLDPIEEARKHYKVGLGLSQQGRFKEAVAEYNEAIRFDPQYAKAYANRAVVYTALGKDTEAEQDVDKAEELGYDRATLEQNLEKIKQVR